MILLDTNVMSELMRTVPDPGVLSWLRSQAREQLATTSVTVAEVGAGLAVMPTGARRRDLQSRWDRLLQAGFGERVLAFDDTAAAVYPEIYAKRRRMGRPAGGFDMQIAAIARCRDAVVATRDAGDFEGCGVVIVNPWTAQAGSKE
jgi:predicted nucleic acid-binding protein